ncbi:MFS transporter [Labilibaculum sp. A4]|uniref:MFS transporter n=1 Tax=Labilibaculum euxinus TaxID=2686357 RepID=UPI000F626682|nr:MFS transporter [Labilibaculum euxinus]MDQ1770076.1 MFS transporter [Labilibaculum euxinus]MWN77497.1 MFS transporter [Labilibaculum euxinus]
MSLTSVFKKFPKTFWVANSIELFERWAWYGFFMLFANYLTGSTDIGALGLSQAEKGTIMGVGTGILYFLPVITGAIADKYGYKLVLAISFVIYSTAFIALPLFDTFAGVFAMYLYLALGAALFKPIISATVAKTTNEETSSIGFGIFYMMVNIGAFIGPLVTLAYKDSGYTTVFYISAGIILINFILILFYKEPEREVKNESIGAAIATVFSNIGKALSDVKFVIFLLLVAAFWSMYYQLFFTLPVFIAQWVDTSSVYHFFESFMPAVTETYGTNGQMDAEFITNFDAMFIIIFQIVISTIVMRWKPLQAMMGGILICTIGMGLTLLTQNVLFVILAIFIFSVGEMASSPKITEYIGRIAPKDKVGLYMGCSFLPVFAGSTIGGVISGNIYGSMSDKVTLMIREVTARGLQIPEISKDFSATDYFNKAGELMGMDQNQLTQYLWNTYNPSNIWYVILAIGFFSVTALYFYDRLLLNKKAQ